MTARPAVEDPSTAAIRWSKGYQNWALLITLGLLGAVVVYGLVWTVRTGRPEYGNFWHPHSTHFLPFDVVTDEVVPVVMMAAVLVALVVIAWVSSPRRQIMRCLRRHPWGQYDAVVTRGSGGRWSVVLRDDDSDRRLRVDVYRPQQFGWHDGEQTLWYAGSAAGKGVVVRERGDTPSLTRSDDRPAAGGTGASGPVSDGRRGDR